MTWDRAAAAKALAAKIGDAVTAAEDTATVFDRPPLTINPPAIVVGRPTEVRYAAFASGIDEATLPVACVGPLDGEDRVAQLVALVRGALAPSDQLGGVVQVAYVTGERNWRNLNVAGTDLLAVDVFFTIDM